MNFIATKLEGCFILEPKVINDDRGYFMESFNENTFQKGVNQQVHFVQDNQSFSSKGVLRGLHYQTGEHAQAKLVRVLQGEVLDVAVDIRPNSPTFGQYEAVVLSGDNQKQFFVPRGFAHGFLVLSETATFFYKCDNFYNKESEGGIIYNDKTINIDWEFPLTDLIISEKDKVQPTIENAKGMVVLVTGANGQLGQSLQFIARNYPKLQFVFCSSSDLNIADVENCEAVFAKVKPNFCINSAAYTAVDKAESEPEKAHSINVDGAMNLAEVCKKHNAILLHVSTDFVFDGSKTSPYTEEDIPNPTGVYGQTKLDGEKAIQSVFDNYYIIRFSWVYSQFGNNFMKTMLRLASERDSLSVVNDQIGTPTNAVDLAEALIKIITSNIQHPTSYFGLYNFSNEGRCSWYDFAKAIFEVNNISIDLKPIPTSAFPTPAKRPAYSVLDKTKIKTTFGIEIKNWKLSLMDL